MYILNIAALSILFGLALGLDLTESNKQRAGCAQVDFNDPTKITYWSPFAGIGPVVGQGIDSVEAENMLSAALDKLKSIDEHQYRLDNIISAVKCILANDMYEFNVNLIDQNSQNKNCVVQIYKHHQQLEEGGSVTAVVISCPDDPQYVQTYISDVPN